MRIDALFGYTTIRPELAVDMAPYVDYGRYMAARQAQALRRRPIRQPQFCSCCGAPPEKDDSACSYCLTSYS